MLLSGLLGEAVAGLWECRTKHSRALIPGSPADRGLEL